MLGVIPKQDIDRMWFLCEPLLQRALRCGDDDYTMEDVRDGVEKGQFLLWAWCVDSKVVCCAVTSFIVYPRKKICAIMMIGGAGMKEWIKSGQEVVATWAKKNGCDELEGYDTRKWLRVLPQWRPIYTTIRRKL